MRRRSHTAEGARDYLADMARARVAAWDFLDLDAAPGVGMLAALEAGDEVTVQGWELGPHRHGFHPTETVMVDADGGLRRA